MALARHFPQNPIASKSKQNKNRNRNQLLNQFGTHLFGYFLHKNLVLDPKHLIRENSFSIQFVSFGFDQFQSQQDGFEIDSLTVSCPNCSGGITLNTAKDGSLKTVGSEHLQCPKTAAAPLGRQNS